MNVRKPVDYSTMYRELTAILAQNLPQMDEIYAIGKGISQRPEKGAAVAAAEFLQANFPDRAGFSPRNVRRMRDFYKVYENDQTSLRLAMKIGWTLNAVIMEAELTQAERKWYLEQAKIRNWTKAELQLAIIAEEHKAAFVEATAANASNQTHRKKTYCTVRGQQGNRENPAAHFCPPQRGRRFAIFRCFPSVVDDPAFAFPDFLCYNEPVRRDLRC